MAAEGRPSAAPELLAPAAAAAEPDTTTTTIAATTAAPLSTAAPDATAHRIVVDGARPAPSSLMLPAGASGVVVLDNRDDVAYEAEIGTPEPFALRLPAGGAAEVDFGEHPPGRYRVTIRIGNGSATATVDSTALDAGDLLCGAVAAVEAAGRDLAAAADRAAAKLTAADPAAFLAEFRALGTADLPRLALPAAELEEAWRAVAAALPAPAADDAAAVADWLAPLAAEAGPARWPAQVAGPWQAGADRVASRATAAAAVVEAECGVALPVPPGLPGGAPVGLLAPLAGPPGFVSPPLDVATAMYDVAQRASPSSAIGSAVGRPRSRTTGRRSSPSSRAWPGSSPRRPPSRCSPTTSGGRGRSPATRRCSSTSSGEPVDRDHTTTQLGPLPAARLDITFEGPAGAERWTVVRGDGGEHAYWVVVIAFESDPYLDAEVDEMLAGFELIGTAT